MYALRILRRNTGNFISSVATSTPALHSAHFLERPARPSFFKLLSAVIAAFSLTSVSPSRLIRLYHATQHAQLARCQAEGWARASRLTQGFRETSALDGAAQGA